MSLMLFRVSPYDPMMFATIALVLAAPRCWLAWFPPGVPSAVDPMVALRHQ